MVILCILVFYAQSELKKHCFKLNSTLWSVKWKIIQFAQTVEWVLAWCLGGKQQLITR